MTEKVWKVCRVNTYTGDWLSFNTEVRLRYALNQKTLPVKGSLGIFAFKSEAAALRFMRGRLWWAQLVTLECEAENVREPGIILKITHSTTRDQWCEVARPPQLWEDRDVTRPPTGTVTCDWVMPTRVVDPWDMALVD